MITTYLEVETGKELEILGEIYGVERTDGAPDDQLRRAIRHTRRSVKLTRSTKQNIALNEKEEKYVVDRICREKRAIELLILAYAHYGNPEENPIAVIIKRFLDDLNEDHKECDYCGKRNEIVQKVADPYQSEIHDDYTEHMICDDCYIRASDEI